MENKIVYILPGLFVIVFICLVLIGNLGPSEACNEKKLFISSTYKAVVVKKYFDKQNHNFRTIVFSFHNKQFTMVLVDDTSGYFEHTNVGDTIYKGQNSEYIQVGAKKFKVYFNCR